MAFAALAILGQRSAHSLPMGPVIAEPTKEPPAFVNVRSTSQLPIN
jgi:hypothetical protein